MQWLAEMGGGKYLRKDETISERKRGGPKNPNLAPWRFGWGHWPWAPWQVCWGHFDPGPLAGLLRPLADLLLGGGCLCLSRGVTEGASPVLLGFHSRCKPRSAFLVQPVFPKHREEGGRNGREAETRRTCPSFCSYQRGTSRVSRGPCWMGLLEDLDALWKVLLIEISLFLEVLYVACFERYKCCFRSGWFRISMASWCYLYPQHIHKTSNFSKIRIIEISPVDWFLTLDILGPVWSLLYWKWNEPHEEFLRSKYSFICIIPQNAEKNWYWWVRQWTSVMFCYFCVWQLNQ